MGWQKVAMGGVVIFMALLWLASNARANRRIVMQGGTALLGSQGYQHLLLLLRQRGFVVQRERSLHPNGKIGVRLEAQGRVIVSQGEQKRIFQIPPLYQEATVRARAVVMFVEIFLETSAAASPSSAVSAPVSSTNPAMRFRSPATQKLFRQNRRLALVRLRPQRARPSSPPKRIAPSSPENRVARALGKVARVPNAQSQPQPHPPNTRIARADLPPPTLRQRISPPASLPTSRPWWLALELGGVAGFHGLLDTPLGGEILLAAGLGRGSLRLALALQRLIGVEQAAVILLRPGLLGAVALLQGKVTLELETGVTLEWINVTAEDYQAARSRLGFLVAGRIVLPFASRWSLVARTAFLLFPQSYRFELHSVPLLETTPWRLEVSLGVSFRLR